MNIFQMGNIFGLLLCKATSLGCLAATIRFLEGTYNSNNNAIYKIAVLVSFDNTWLKAVLLVRSFAVFI